MSNSIIYIEDASMDGEVDAEPGGVPSNAELTNWAHIALPDNKPYELSIRIINSKEMLTLNSKYRQQNKTTNVLSFPSELPDFIKLDVQPLGDIAICADVVNLEAQQQNKNQNAHWAHIVIHGCLHLQGFDHIDEAQAQEMEALEIKLLKQLNFASPY